MGPSRVSDVKFEPFRSRKQNRAYREMTGSPPAPKLVRCAFESFSTAARSQCLSQFLDRFSGLCFDRRERSNVRHRECSSTAIILELVRLSRNSKNCICIEYVGRREHYSPWLCRFGCD